MDMFDSEAEHILPPFAKALGAELVQLADRVCLVKVPYADFLVGDPDTGVIHGGVITAILDNASGWSVRCHEDWQDGDSMATLDLRIDYMKPATPHENLLVKATCFKITNHVAFVRGFAFHHDEHDPVATSVAAFMLGTANKQGKNL